MTNEMKLITALCEALGFEIKIERDFKERKEGKTNAMHYQSNIDYPQTMGRRLQHTGQRLKIDKDGNYTSQLIEPVLSYKLIKRSE